MCRLYLKPPPEPLIHARALLAFIQEWSPEFIGGYVPRPDLERLYRRDLCNLKGWQPFHWTAIARQLGQFTHKKTVREKGSGSWDTGCQRSDEQWVGSWASTAKIRKSKSFQC